MKQDLSSPTTAQAAALADRELATSKRGQSPQEEAGA